ncbi:MAG: 4Fe-4S dicluster domain-containing protein [Dehalococcoidia bacterium]|jgi:molybdopterin-containing oxidoreductase family iron-sulfur binding subunit|nr:4Fe-4S dicluster domain-containing protein [Dehalococcoidia bacterium]
MEVDRRGFIKIAGLVVAGLAIPPVFNVFSSTEMPKTLESGTLAKAKLAMVVKLENCKDGCTDCIDACHSIHNVPDFGNPKDEIKWIWTDPYEHVFPEQQSEFTEESLKEKPVLVLCNHCDNPPCTRVCPVKATWKREDGIVMMDFHRCIGCRFCMSACPYGSRSFNWRDPREYIKEANPDFPTRTKGVVEKCNFCAERLREGLIPACVEACEDKALVFGDLEDPNSEVSELISSNYTLRRHSGLGTEPKVYYLRQDGTHV